MQTTRTAAGITIALVVLVGAAAFIPVQTTLVVTDTETGEQVIETDVTEGTPVHLEYTHSVERTPIIESYEVSGTELAEEKIIFRSFGAGLPATANMTVTDEGYVVHSNETYDSLTVALDPIPNHTLVVNEQEYHLLEKANGSVSIAVEQQSFLETALTSVAGDLHETCVGSPQEYNHPNILSSWRLLPAVD